MTRDDYPDVACIHQAGLDTGNGAYEASPVTWEEFVDKKIPELCFVAEDEGKILGWVALMPFYHRRRDVEWVPRFWSTLPQRRGSGARGPSPDGFLRTTPRPKRCMRRRGSGKWAHSSGTVGWITVRGRTNTASALFTKSCCRTTRAGTIRPAGATTWGRHTDPGRHNIVG